MKKYKLQRFAGIIISAAMVFSIAPAAMAEEQPVYKGFYFEEDPEYEGWEFVDWDNDGSNWEHKFDEYNYDPFGGKGLITSASTYSNEAMSSDNWAFSPAIDIPEGNFYVSVYAKKHDPDSAREVFAIYAGEGSLIRNMKRISDDTDATDEYIRYTADLSEYAGKTVYIAICHYNMHGMSGLDVDSVEILKEGAPVADEAYDLWINGVMVTNLNRDNIPAERGSASFDPQTNTLSFTNASYTSEGWDGRLSVVYSQLSELKITGTANITNDWGNGIYAIGDIIFEGENTDITVKGSKYGVYADEGSVYVNGGKLIAEAAEKNGIYAENNVEIDGAEEVSAEGEMGIMANNKLIITGGKTNASGQSTYGNGLYGHKGVEISGGEITAYGKYAAVFGYDGDITISGDSTKLTADSGDGETGSSEAVFSLNGEIKIESPLGITYPLGGKLSEDRKTICESDGTTEAARAVIEKKPFVTGDADGDGQITAKDKAILNRYLAGWQGYEEKIVNMDALDFDGDRRVTAKDKAILNRYLAGWAGYDKYFSN